MSIGKVTPLKLREMKDNGEKITLMVVYEYPLARILDESGVDMFLVGDSVGTVINAKRDDIYVTLDEIIYHTQGVSKAADRAMVVADMPFMSYHVSIEEAKRNSGRLIQEGGADAVKLEGGAEIADTVSAIVRAGIPVMGHIGLINQARKLTGARKVRGRTEEDRRRLIEDAKALEEAGVFCLGLELMTKQAAREITQTVTVPTNGIGAGPHCDGQALNLYDVIGLTAHFEAKFVKRYVDVRTIIGDAVKRFVQEVGNGSFPDDEHSYGD